MTRRWPLVIGLSGLLITFSILPGCQSQPAAVHKNVQYVSGADEVTYLRLGKEITYTVGRTLKLNLMKHISESGTVNAIKFCNVRASGLTQSFSEKYNTEVKRISSNNRNAGNAPDDMEATVISDYQNLLDRKMPLKPKVAIDAQGKKHFYAPILTDAVCLNCHGDAETLQPDVVQVLDSLYPMDKARDYGLNELRGIWSVKFKNS